MKTVEIAVKSEMYGTTTCVVDIETFKKGRLVFPCGDGCIHHLTSQEIGMVRRECGMKKKGYIRKTIDEWEVQGLYGKEWEMVTTANSKKEVNQLRYDYVQNEANTRFRIVKKRVKINETVN